MVSGGTVKNDASILEGYLNNYKAEIGGLDGSWKGPSYDSINSQAESFIGEYNQIVSQMNNFANACIEYQEYIYLKNLIAETEADRANASDNVKYTYDQPLSQMRSALETRKRNINNYLNSASSLSLTATPVSTEGSSTISGLMQSSNSSSGSSSDNKEFVESLYSQVGNTIANYSGFNDGQWCADFVSNSLIEAGYDIQWSSIAGDGEGTILGSLRNSGATVHLDVGAQGHGIDESNPEYDPDYVPQPGDVVVFDFGYNGVGINDHTGFVIQDNGDGTITTIEGNTSGDAGDSCVAIHENRNRSEVYGYATPVKNGK